MRALIHKVRGRLESDVFGTFSCSLSGSSGSGSGLDAGEVQLLTQMYSQMTSDSKYELEPLPETEPQLSRRHHLYACLVSFADPVNRETLRG